MIFYVKSYIGTIMNHQITESLNKLFVKIPRKPTRLEIPYHVVMRTSDRQHISYRTKEYYDAFNMMLCHPENQTIDGHFYLPKKAIELKFQATQNKGTTDWDMKMIFKKGVDDYNPTLLQELNNLLDKTNQPSSDGQMSTPNGFSLKILSQGSTPQFKSFEEAQVLNILPTVQAFFKSAKEFGITLQYKESKNEKILKIVYPDRQ